MNFNCSPTCFRFNLITRWCCQARPISFVLWLQNVKSKVTFSAKKKLSLANTASTLVSVSVSALWWWYIWSLVFSSISAHKSSSCCCWYCREISLFRLTNKQFVAHIERDRDGYTYAWLDKDILYALYMPRHLTHTHSSARGPSPSPNQIHI